MTSAAPASDRWRDLFRRHERLLAAAWLGLAGLGALGLAMTPMRVRLLDALQAAVVRWDDRWTRRLAHGEGLFARGRYEEASAYLERLDAAFPARGVRHGRDRERERLLRLLARSYEAQDRKGRAMATWDRLVAFDSLNYHNHFERARAADRLLSGWALAPEARDGYVGVLQLFPSHLPSVRGYIDYYMDRGEFQPVVQAYRDYLDAFLIQRVIVKLGGDSVTAMLQVDGLPRDVELPLSAPAGSPGPLTIRSGGFALRLDRAVLLPAATVGSVQPLDPLMLSTVPVALAQMEPADGGGLRPLGDSTVAAFDVPSLRTGVAGVRLRISLFKPVDEVLWRSVAKGHRNLLDHDGLAAAAARTVTIPSADAADQVIAGQAWAREGVEARLDDGP